MSLHSLRREPLCKFERLLPMLLSLVHADGIQASNSRFYKDACFGRDELEVALDLLRFMPELAEQVIVSLAGFQGTAHDSATFEEPGKCHHEHRSLVVGGKPVSSEVEALYYRVGQAFGVDLSGGEWTQYGAIDVTPNFVRLVCTFQQLYPDRSILDRRYRAHDGSDRTIRQAVLGAVEWIESKLYDSEPGLLDSRGPSQPFWQVMRDGRTSHLHEDGTLANSAAPIAPLDVQALAYDALELIARTLPGDRRSTHWKQMAAKLRHSIFELYWMEDTGSFAMALDRDPASGRLRAIRTLSSVQFELLDTMLFDGLPESSRQRYIEAIVRWMFSPEFLTPVGLRMRAKRHAGLVDYPDYQGSLVSWAVTTNRAARGLRRQGLPELADYLEDRVVSGLDETGTPVEYWYADVQNVVAYFVHDVGPEHPNRIRATNLPEAVQAWTISAALRILYERMEEVGESGARAAWKYGLVAVVDSGLRRPYEAYVDEVGGQAAEAAFLKRQ